MMSALLVLILVLVVHSFTLSGAGEGLAFYLLPDWSRATGQGLGNVITAAMNQSFFTLSLGIGAIEIFGSYMDRGFTLPGEAPASACWTPLWQSARALSSSRPASPSASRPTRDRA